MKNNSKSIKICVHFGLTKGEGEWPSASNLTNQEKSDPRNFSTFFLDIDEDGSSIDPDIIKSCKVIYNGVSPVKYENGVIVNKSGLHIFKKEIVGKPEPIIEFELTQSVDEQDFIKLIWMSYYKLQPKNTEDAFYAEDHNGYTSVLSEENTKELIKIFKEHKVYSGKKFEISDLTSGISAKNM